MSDAWKRNQSQSVDLASFSAVALNQHAGNGKEEEETTAAAFLAALEVPKIGMLRQKPAKRSSSTGKNLSNIATGFSSSHGGSPDGWNVAESPSKTL